MKEDKVIKLLKDIVKELKKCNKEMEKVLGE
jgi:hypothetical protein